MAMPRWSPDGWTIAFIEGLMSDEGFTGGDVFTVSATGANAKNRTPERKIVGQFACNGPGRRSWC